MVGIIVRYAGWDKNIFKEMFKKINLNNIKFTVKYWESYGDLYEDYNDINSDTFKNIIEANECYPEFCELFVSNVNDEYYEIDTYGDFLISKYFLSVAIIDHRNIEICLKDNNFTKQFVKNISSLKVDNLEIIELNSISLDSKLSIWRQKEKGIY